MAAQKGKDLLLKVDSDGLGTFTTVAGLRSRTIAFNAESVDVTHAESAGQWRELLAGAGVKSARVTGAGIFKDASSDEIVRSYVFNGTIRNWQVIVPDFGSIEGPFHIGSFELTGRHDGEVGFEMALESAGQLTFTAAT
ncbi:MULTISPECIES: phage major tail protein, TP901-1 family [Hyphomicrobium]|nr:MULTISPECIES: phage major tail protein, TP901-1 family [Hyphomicrobium]MBI1650829.1 phage major tail protein, TP901-1 family [Hyphomicrobium sulfonivorans]MDH4981300.1 phage major tail protein, TP901-1 family [Hyphomicrobium sp. D-2]NSL71815.1 phage major tail protein, TP901-1 family [Hyphomicrobium sulfonivorans]